MMKTKVGIKMTGHALKDIEVRLVAELLKNSRRSDRELAKILGVSQPTISRLIRKLEKKGVIRGYTILPDLAKLGYTILAINFIKLRSPITSGEVEKAREYAKTVLKEGPFEIVMGERGMGLGFDGVFISYHQDYSSYMKIMSWLRQFDFLELEKSESFLINLNDTVRYRPLSFVTLGKHLLATSAK